MNKDKIISNLIDIIREYQERDCRCDIDYNEDRDYKDNEDNEDNPYADTYYDQYDMLEVKNTYEHAIAYRNSQIKSLQERLDEKTKECNELKKKWKYDIEKERHIISIEFKDKIANQSQQIELLNKDIMELSMENDNMKAHIEKIEKENRELSNKNIPQEMVRLGNEVLRLQKEKKDMLPGVNTMAPEVIMEVKKRWN